MARCIYYVVRKPGGWAVEHEDAILCCYRTQEQAVAQARLIGRDRGLACDIKVQEPSSGKFRTEVTYGLQPTA